MAISAGVFIGVAALLCLIAILAILGITHVYLLGSDSIERDGLRRGTQAPSWSLLDSFGNLHHSPPRSPLQLIIFGDHSLKSFPSVVEGLQKLSKLVPDLDMVFLVRKANNRTGPMLEILGLAGLPISIGSDKLYGRYNVRVMPFVMFIDSAGLVRGSGLINYAWQLETLYRLAQIPVTPIKSHLKLHRTPPLADESAV